jgi:hypothetical protein
MGNYKTPGGCTGKGWTPGRSGNRMGRPRELGDLRRAIRRYLWGRHPDHPDKFRLQVLIVRLEKEDPRTLLRYAFGKPDRKARAYAVAATIEAVPHGTGAGAPIEMTIDTAGQVVRTRQAGYRGFS